MNLKVSNEIPTMRITRIKEAPMDGFDKAEDLDTGLYITNRGEYVGVMLTTDQYEALITELKVLRKQTKDLIN